MLTLGIPPLYNCFLARHYCSLLSKHNAIYYGGPPLCSGRQSPWLQIQRSGLDSRLYQTFWEVVGLERSPFSLVSKTEELFERKSSGSYLGHWDYGRRDPPHWPRDIPLSAKVSTKRTSGGRSVIDRSKTKATELLIFAKEGYSRQPTGDTKKTPQRGPRRESHGPQPVPLLGHCTADGGML
jgi:hypothetical protein